MIFSGKEEFHSTQQAVSKQGLPDPSLPGRIEGAKGQAELARTAPKELQGGLDGNGVGGPAEHIPAEREKPAVPFLCFGQPAGFKGANESLQVARHNIADDGHDTAAADAKHRKGQAVVATEDAQVRRRGNLRGLIERTGGFLDPHDVWYFRQTGDGFGENVGAGPPRNVVKDNRQIHRFGHSCEMAVVPFLRRLVVIWADHQSTVRSGAVSEAWQPNRLARAFGACTRSC